MAGTKAGGAKAALRNKEKYGEDFYKNIGAVGGTKSTTGGFYYAKKNYSIDDPRHPANSGKKGGKARQGFRKVTA